MSRNDLIAATIELSEALLLRLGARYDEAKRSYYYDDVTYKQWILGDGGASGTNCELCEENADTGEIDMDALFPSGDDEPPGHPNCFLGDTTVSAAGVSRSFKRRFKGEIVTLRIAGVKDLSCTPNHPILTRRGWVPAGKLQFSDDLVQCVDPRRVVAFLYPENYYVETSIEKIANSLLMAGGMLSTSVPISAEAFHGDSEANGKVDIVRSTRFLGSNLLTSTQEQFSVDNVLARSHFQRTPFIDNGTFAQFFNASGHPSDGIVGVSGAGGPLLCSQLRMHIQACGSTVALLETENVPVPCYRDSGYANPFRNGENAFASLMRFVKLSKIERCHFDGHVFNLETMNGWYCANSIVAHNCTCTIEYRDTRKRVYV